jgi:hypothetical protein
MAGLDAADITWEGSEAVPEGAWHLRVRVAAIDEQSAIAAVRTAPSAQIAFGAYTAFAASAVRNCRGEVWRGAVAPSWSDIDWQADPRRARLGEEQRALIGCLLDDAEPTWIVASDPDVSSDRRQVESAFTDLEAEGLVFSLLAQAAEPGTESHLERWWAATDVLGPPRPDQVPSLHVVDAGDSRVIRPLTHQETAHSDRSSGLRR